MWSNLLLMGLGPAIGISAAVARRETRGVVSYVPDQGNLLWENEGTNKLPISYNLSDSQEVREVQIDGSFWANSFIRGSNGRNYYAAGHVQSYASDIEGALPSYRAGILDLTDVDGFYKKFVRIAPANTSFWADCGHMNATFEGGKFGFGASNPKNPLEGIRYWSEIGGVEFDITFNFSSPALLNGALGSYQVGGDQGYEWSVPKGVTSGWVKVNGEIVDIVPEESLTWYDRQWASLQDSFNWIMLQFDESDWLDISVMTVWDWTDAVNGRKEFATIRDPHTGRDSVVPAILTPSTTNVYVSPDTSISYPLEWTILIEDIEIKVTCPRPDQVFETGPGTGFPPQLSGYVDAVARKAGEKQVKGFGATDVMDI